MTALDVDEHVDLDIDWDATVPCDDPECPGRDAIAVGRRSCGCRDAFHCAPCLEGYYRLSHKHWLSGSLKCRHCLKPRLVIIWREL